MNKLVQCAMRGLECTALDRKKIPTYLLLFSYVADVSECEDVLVVKRGTKTSSSCHNCLLSKNKFASSRTSTKWTLKNSLGVLARVTSGLPFAEEDLQINSMLPITLVLCEFSFIGIHSFVDIYQTFRVESMHSFPFEISKML